MSCIVAIDLSTGLPPQSFPLQGADHEKVRHWPNLNLNIKMSPVGQYFFDLSWLILILIAVSFSNHRYVLVKLAVQNMQGSAIAATLAQRTLYALTWTTTSWTLPANQAISINASYNYSVVEENGSGDLYLIADTRESFILGHVLHGKLVGSVNGADLIGTRYLNLITRTIHHIIAADFVSDEAGTGLVHTAPAHGHEDYDACLEHNLTPVSFGLFHFLSFCSLKRQSISTESTKLRLRFRNACTVFQCWPAEPTKSLNFTLPKSSSNMSIITAFLTIGERALEFSLGFHSISDNERPTKQWFMDLSKAKKKSLESLTGVEMIPATSRHRLASFIESRNEWCLSRQRCWGVPIPAFIHKETGN